MNDSTPDHVPVPPEPPFGEPSSPVFGTGPEPPTPDPSGVRDRLAVVTGATGLLGAAIAAELSARGAIVCLVGRDLQALLDAERALGPGARAAVLRCDLAVGEDVASAVDFVERLDRPVDLVVHAAGLQAQARIADAPVEDLDEHYLLNVRGPYLLTQRLLPLLRDGSARCVFIAAADTPGASGGDAHHTITQAGTRALADELRVEAAPRGVRVLTVIAQDEAGVRRGVVDADAFATALATTVVDALGSPDLDLTELVVRGVARPMRADRR